MYDNYNLNCGPLWIAKLLPWSPLHTAYLDRTLVPAEGSTSEDRIPEPPKHCHVNHVILGWHHSIVDGYSCMRLIRNFLCIIDDLIDGRKPNESVQISSFISSECYQATEDKIEMELSAHPELLNDILKYEEQSWSRTILHKVIKMKPKSPLEMALIPFCLDIESTQKFIFKCKQERVSVHSGFCTVVNAATIKIMQNEGLTDSSYNISTRHLVSGRSMHHRNVDAFGLKVAPLSFFLTVPNNIRTDFWNCARDFHEQFKLRLRRNPSEISVAEKLSGINVGYFLPPEGVKEFPLRMRSYHVSNMLDITHILGDCGSNVQLEYIQDCSEVSLTSAAFSSFFRTLRGRLLHSLEYNTGLVDDDTAQKISRSIFIVLQEILN